MSSSQTPRTVVEGALVHVQHQDTVAFLALDTPPVNALSRDLRQALIDGISALANDEGTQAIVLIGAHDTFIAGADLGEFGQPLSEPTLPEVISVVRADDLGAVPLKSVMAQYPSVEFETVDEVVFGCVNQAGEDNRNVAGRVAKFAGSCYIRAVRYIKGLQLQLYGTVKLY